MQIAVLGVGVMGATLLSALVRAGQDPAGVSVSDKMAARTAEVASEFGVTGTTPDRAVLGADIVIIAVKPQDMPGLLAQCHANVSSDALVLSIAAGISTEYLEDRLPAGTSVVRVMPNTPALVDQAMSALASGQHCTAEHMAQAEDLLATVGKVVVLDEGHMDAVTAISGSGPAYIFYVVEAMIEAGVLLGLPRATATELSVQTLFGAATMLRQTGQHPTVLREQVSSPGGTSVAALRALEDHKVRAAFMSAMEAAAKRSAELSSGSLS
ncbi:pyrroline-5-carboxylate reductase [Ornithinimicrobium sp. Arc0846-15]|nr:pyrroline-5-carboxylate reductase [Ornithinimicrobium laminariae]